MGIGNSIIDQKIESYKKSVYEKKYEIIQDLLSQENDDDSLHELFNMLEIYMDEYSNTECLNEDKFRHDTKLLFKIVKQMFCDGTLKNEMEEELKERTSDIALKEYDDYIQFSDNIENISQVIDTIDLNNQYFSERCQQCIQYLKQKNDDLNSLHETIKGLNDTLQNAAAHLMALSNDSSKNDD